MNPPHPKRGFSNTSTVREDIMTFPDGGNLYAKVTETTRASGVKERQWQLVWERPNQPPKRLQVRGGDDMLLEWVLDVLPRGDALASCLASARVCSLGRMLASRDVLRARDAFA